MCLLKLFLNLKSFPQTLHGRDTPSKWWPSIWSLMAIKYPSFPHSLQILAFCLPLGSKFELASIIDFTSSSSRSMSPGEKFGIATFCLSNAFKANRCPVKCSRFVCMFGWSPFRNWLEFILWVEGSVESKTAFSSLLSLVFPISPFSLRSSAMLRKELRLSWKTFASPR